CGRSFGITVPAPALRDAGKQAKLLDYVRQFNDAPELSWRGTAMLGFFGGCTLLILFCALLQAWPLVGAFTALAALPPLCWFVVNGITRRTHLFGKVCELLLASTWAERLIALASGGLILLLLALFHLLGLGLGTVILAASFAVALHVGIDRRLLARQRQIV